MTTTVTVAIFGAFDKEYPEASAPSGVPLVDAPYKYTRTDGTRAVVLADTGRRIGVVIQTVVVPDGADGAAELERAISDWAGTNYSNPFLKKCIKQKDAAGKDVPVYWAQVIAP